MSQRSITILATGAVLAALAPASAALAQSAPAPAGVPAGRIELTIRSVHVTGSHAVAQYERTRQYLTAGQSHTITMTVRGHHLRPLPRQCAGRRGDRRPGGGLRGRLSAGF